MGAIIEESKWSNDIYRIQKTDPVLGGQDGIINIQPTQVANRTRYLKDTLELEHTQDGEHSLKNESFSENAGLPESILALKHSTASLKSKVNELEGAIQQLQSGVDNALGENGALIDHLSQIAILNWRYGIWGADFEFFVDRLTMRDTANVDARAAIGRDDSIDCADTRGFRPGMRLLVSDGEQREEVTIRSVLERGRIRLTEDLSHTYAEPATLGYTDWDLSSPGRATVSKNQIYFSKIMDTFRNCGAGILLVCMENHGNLKVDYREYGDDSPWETAISEKTFPARDAFVYKCYSIFGEHLQLRIEGNSDETFVIRHMALIPTPFNFLPSSIRTPQVLLPEAMDDIWEDVFCLESSEFLSAYKDKYVQTEYGLFQEGKNAPVKIFDLRTNGLNVLEDIPDMPKPGKYSIRCRHQSDVGEWSLWSEAVPVTLRAIRVLFGFKNSAKSDGFNKAQFDRLDFYPARFGFAGAKRSFGFGFPKVAFTTKLED